MSTPTATIVIADQDDTERMFLTDSLTADGYSIVPVASRSAALERLHEQAVDLVIADVNGDTLGLLDTIRNVEALQALTRNDVPVIVLTRHAHELHLVRLLERGGDDVVAKPFSYPELRARVAALLRRTAPRRPAARRVAGEIVIDLRSREVTVAGEPVALSATEYELLTTLAAEPTRTFTRAELMRIVWGYSGHHTRTLDSHACRLRARLAGAGHPRRRQRVGCRLPAPPPYPGGARSGRSARRRADDRRRVEGNDMSRLTTLTLQVLVPDATSYAIGDEIWQVGLADAIAEEADTIASLAGAELLEEPGRNALRLRVIHEMTDALVAAGDTYTAPDGVAYVLTNQAKPDRSAEPDTLDPVARHPARPGRRRGAPLREPVRRVIRGSTGDRSLERRYPGSGSGLVQRRDPDSEGDLLGKTMRELRSLHFRRDRDWLQS